MATGGAVIMLSATKQRSRSSDVFALEGALFSGET